MATGGGAGGGGGGGTDCTGGGEKKMVESFVTLVKERTAKGNERQRILRSLLWMRKDWT